MRAIRRFSFQGLKSVEITPGFILLLSYLLFIDKMFIIFITVSVVHELAHIITTAALGGRVSACRLSLTGAFISIERLSYGREAVAVAAGPLVSLITAFAAACLGYGMFAGVSMFLGLLNLLPAAGLDGGRLAELLLSRNGNVPCGTLNLLTILSALLLTAPLAVSFMNGINNYSLAVFVVYLILGVRPTAKRTY